MSEIFEGARVRAVKGGAAEAGARLGRVLRADRSGVVVLWDAWPMPCHHEPRELALVREREAKREG